MLDIGVLKINDDDRKEDSEVEPEYHYVGLSFENKQFTTEEEPVFQEKYYEYKSIK